jgi:putative ABC transport system permease protein
MIKNYLTIIYRNLVKNNLYSFINIFSLALGIAACIVIYLFVRDEQSFDQFHSKADNIYRLEEIQSFTGTNVQKVALSMPGMGPNLIKEFPEVTNFTRFWGRGKQLYVFGDKSITVEKTVAVDSTFLELFDFKLLKGDKNTALDEPNSIILTKETALSFFPNIEEAFDKIFTVSGNAMKVTGILEDVPENSHLQFDVLSSITSVTSETPEFNDRWGSNFLNTYLLLTEDVDLNSLEGKFPDFMLRHMPPEEGQSDNINNYYKLYVKSLKDVHLASIDVEHDYNNYRKFNGSYINIFLIAGIFILLIASVNFMNLTTARASYRWKEVGVRKSVGAGYRQLFSQFILESVMLALTALVFALLIVIVAIPFINDAIGRSMNISHILGDGLILAGLTALVCTLGILAGIYPSIILTSVKTANILKGGTTKSGKNIFQNSLIIVQFGLAISMIICTLVVLQQINYINTKDLGFDKEQIVLVDMNQTANENFDVLKNELLSNSKIEGVTASGQRIGNNFHQWSYKVKTDTAVTSYTPSNVNVEFDFLKVYGIELLEGRSFDKSVPTDDGYAFIINESLAKDLGIGRDKIIGTPAGHGWYHDDSLGSIIGVVKDFNFNSLHYQINTLSMVVHPEWGYDECSIKISGNDIQGTLNDIEKTWTSIVPDWPFEYTFLDDHFEELYRSDEQMSAVVSIMAVLSILIACMGLFGLAAITTEKRTKEIGIRKVLGATRYQINVTLSKNFILLILISFLLFIPLTVLVLNYWLQNFAYRIELSPTIFLAGGLISVLIALFTVSYHTIKTASKNPSDTLRYE